MSARWRCRCCRRRPSNSPPWPSRRPMAAARRPWSTRRSGAAGRSARTRYGSAAGTGHGHSRRSSPALPRGWASTGRSRPSSTSCCSTRRAASSSATATPRRRPACSPPSWWGCRRPSRAASLVVRHKGREARLDLHCDDPAEVAFAAFYADCVHEVLPVTEGCRLILVYNLVRRGRGRAPEPPDYAAEQARVTTLLRRWQRGKRRRGRRHAREAGLPPRACLHAGGTRLRRAERRRCRGRRGTGCGRAGGAVRPAPGTAHRRGERRGRICRELRLAPGAVGY